MFHCDVSLMRWRALCGLNIHFKCGAASEVRLRFRACKTGLKKGRRKVKGVPQSQAAALPRHQEEEETDKTKQAKQKYEKH